MPEERIKEKKKIARGEIVRYSILIVFTIGVLWYILTDNCPICDWGEYYSQGYENGRQDTINEFYYNLNTEGFIRIVEENGTKKTVGYIETDSDAG